MNLPILVRGFWGAWLYFFIGGVATIVLYQTTNRHHLFEPQILEMGWLDQRVPLIPWTIWVYFTEYVIFIVSWLAANSDVQRTRYFFSYMTILIVSCTIFVFWPTTFPRADFPLDSFPDSLSKDAFIFLRTHMDTPANCVPSLHVSSCLIAALVFLRQSKTLFTIFFVWFLAVAASTMTTKQHYFVDIWTAVLLTVVCYWIFFHKANYYEQGSTNSAGAKL